MRDSSLATPLDSGLPPDCHGTVVTVGTFDGVHRGHRDVLARMVERASALGVPSVLVTFDPHPLAVVNPAAAPPLLTTTLEKAAIVAESGIDYMAVLPFTPTLQSYAAGAFVDDVLRRRFRVRHLVIGYDHGFGRGREGDADVLQALGRARGFDVEVVPPVMLDDARAISSTLVRRAVAGGDLARAERALGRRYSVSGRVRRGDRRGRLLGFPTINIAAPIGRTAAPGVQATPGVPGAAGVAATPNAELATSPAGTDPAPPPARKLLPPEGVYAVRVETPCGAFGGMMNLGPRPTFGDPTTSLEAHLFDAQVDLYEAFVTVEFVTRLRETRAFPGPEALVAQLRHDADEARRALTRLG